MISPISSSSYPLRTPTSWPFLFRSPLILLPPQFFWVPIPLRLQVVPHFPSGIVEQVKPECVKVTPCKKSAMQRGVMFTCAHVTFSMTDHKLCDIGILSIYTWYRYFGICQFFLRFTQSPPPQRNISYIPTLPDYPGVSCIWHWIPALPYRSPNLLDQTDFWAFLCFSLNLAHFFPKNLYFFISRVSGTFLHIFSHWEGIFCHYNDENEFWQYAVHMMSLAAG